MAVGASVAVLGVVLSAMPAMLKVEEGVGLGWLFIARGPLEPPPEVVIVGLSSESADAFGISSDVDEWPRWRHGELVERLAAAGALAIVFDIIFNEPREHEPDGDARFAAQIERAGNVILAERVREVDGPFFFGETRSRPIEPLRRAALATAPFLLPLVPTRVGQSWTFGRGGDTPSLPAAALHTYALPVHDRLLEMIAAVRPALESEIETLDFDAGRGQGLQEIMRRLRATFDADPALAHDLRTVLDAEPNAKDRTLLRALVELYAGGDSRYVNYYGPAQTITTIPYHEVLRAEPSSLRAAVAGRVVFVGFSEPRRGSEQQDEFVSVFTNRMGQRLSGVEIGATAFANLLTLDSIRPVPLPWHWAIVAAWGVLAAAVSLLLRGFGAVAGGLAVGAAFAGGVHYAFQAHHIWAPLVVPLGVQLPVALLVGMSWSHRVLRHQRERIRSALGYYLPPAAVDRLARESLRPRANRELVLGTCLVTDAEQYTTLSETLHPSELGELMDAYYDVLVQAVHRHGGVVSDIGGDSMIAVWPDTTSTGSTRIAASRAALDVLTAVEAFNAARTRAELPTRVGVDSGELLLGNVGASVRGEYRAVGDIVNTASRLQGLNRLLGTRILVSAAAAENVAGAVYRPLGEFLLVGKRMPVSVLELQGFASGVASAVLELDEAFAKALERFRLGDFTGAHSRFEAILERFPAERASLFFCAECRALAERFSSGGWDGVVRVTVK